MHGRQSHAAMPWEGENGNTALLAVLASLAAGRMRVDAGNKELLGLLPARGLAGAACGIAQGDELSGELTISLDLLKLDGDGMEAQLDSRVPICASETNCKIVAEEKLRALGFEVESWMQKAHHTPAEGEFVQALLECYETYTGRKGECKYTGGGTYVHDIEGGVAFGAGMPGFASNLHGANERINMHDSLEACKIFALVIAKLCGE